MEIEFLPPESVDTQLLRIVVIGAREEGRWIFVKNRERRSWELPAGHIEEGESPEEAARRELWEESGASGSMEHLADYRVSEGESTSYGSLFLVLVSEREALPGYETTEVLLSDGLPEELGFAAVQTALFRRLEMSLRS